MERRVMLKGMAAPARMARPAVLMAEANESERRRTDTSDGEPALTPLCGEAMAHWPKAVTGSLLAEMLS